MKNIKEFKKWGFLFSLVFVLMMIPNKVLASSTLKLTGVNSYAPGETISIDVSVTSSETNKYTGFNGTLQYDSKVFTLSSITPATGWSGTNDIGESGKEIKFTNATGASGTFKVATLKFKVGSSVTATSGSISISSVSLSYKDENSSETLESLSSQSKTLDVKSTDNTLKAFKINGVNLDGFSSNVTEYEKTVSSKESSLKIAVTTNSDKATLKNGYGNRTVELNYGENEIKVIVVSETGVEKTYKLKVTREDTRNNDSTLSKITIDGEEIKNFRSNSLHYSIKKFKTDKVVVAGVPTDKNAIVKVEGPQTLVEGENKYSLIVTSEKGESTTYTLIINNISSPINKKLKNLSVSGYDIQFDKNEQRYEIAYNKNKFKKLRIYYSTIASQVDEVTVTVTPDINNNKDSLDKLEVGDVISIKIEGIDGESVEYTIEIVKDKRVNFFFILEVALMIIIAISIAVIYFKRKNNKGKPKINKKETTVVKSTPEKRKVVVPEATEEVKSTKTTKAKPVEKEKPKKRRFSIFEDEYEEVEVEVDEDEDTIEISSEELKLK